MRLPDPGRTIPRAKPVVGTRTRTRPRTLVYSVLSTVSIFEYIHPTHLVCLMKTPYTYLRFLNGLGVELNSHTIPATINQNSPSLGKIPMRAGQKHYHSLSLKLLRGRKLTTNKLRYDIDGYHTRNL